MNGMPVSFHNCAYFGEKYCEDSTLMLLRLLQRCECEEVYIAGFDGFGGHTNYYDQNYTRESGRFIDRDTVIHLLTTTLKDVQLRFITPSLYQSAAEK